MRLRVRSSRAVVLFLHTRYRVTGGEERAVGDLAWLAEDRLGEPVARLERDSARLGRARAAAGLLAGGLDPTAVADAVRRHGADVVHAHNLHPTLGWRALAAARAAGARTILHLHNYRLVCAVGTCVDPAGADCTRCHGRDTRPGLRLACRGAGRAEAAAYAAGLALQHERLLAHADVVAVPSVAAATRLRALGARLPADVHVLGHVVRPGDGVGAGGTPGGGALVVSRLAPEKAVDVAIAACRAAGVPLVIAGDGPERGRLEALAAGGDVTFAGHVADAELHGLRARAAVALAPTRAEETFGLAALEAMAAGLPVVATAAGALRELGDDVLLVPREDPGAMAAALAAARAAGPELGARARAAALRRAGPDAVAPRLAALYAAARAR